MKLKLKNNMVTTMTCFINWKIKIRTRDFFARIIVKIELIEITTSVAIAAPSMPNPIISRPKMNRDQNNIEKSISKQSKETDQNIYTNLASDISCIEYGNLIELM